MLTKALPSGIGVYHPCDCVSKGERDSENAVSSRSNATRMSLAPDAATVARLLADLENRSFDKRGRATKELRRLGDRAGPALREFLRGAPTLEGRRRAEEIVAELERAVVPREQLRDLRAVEALEWAGATDVLRKLAAGMPEARLTREAKAALVRLGAMKPGG